ncbi:hypothetical protein IHE55_28405 [Streptomyces pactum]|uniref:Beta-ketoacyl synthase N-terminal domain-containing protein n=1 Tax=Streptomyces pactum TaxID=68249 RepID=A0ABS0NTJ3_9ACTN|nr:hypothetical protein [Streptomyces pactum]MBH5338498.1 hypothetical protein [Streptomyces pactum]
MRSHAHRGIVVTGTGVTLPGADRPEAVLDGHARGADLAACLAGLAAVTSAEPVDRHVPAGGARGTTRLPEVPRHDLTVAWGSCSGAPGVPQCVAAVGAFNAGTAGAVYATAGEDEPHAVAGLALTSPSGS